ncbi:MAG: D-alanine--D-alanine ligase [Leptospiraceae bacterium]|nr:D-alanine--D-alanine ligase [Leptospiraceae bacterium]MCK6380010.1 D-alanine--D-alanine ligase [Leptospiraceae bacterium]NUM40314.1 D-alanine--D-alanine ligase [Leptospiraceae bacterium]
MKKKVAILMGGMSTEHEISLLTGAFIFKTLLRDKYDIKIIPIDKKGNWVIPESFENYLPPIDSKEINSEKFFSEFKKKNSIVSSNSISIEKINCDLVILGLHGGEGEDGTIQGLLKSYRIPFTGSDILASSLAMDKYRANILFKNSKLNVANFLEITKGEFESIDFHVEKINLQFPIFVKPTLGGSSVGIGKVFTQDELYSKLKELFQKEEKILLQEFVSGREFSCGVIEKKINNQFIPFALPATEIIPSNEFFDYEAKYKIGGSKEITPAEISEDLMNKIQLGSLQAHTLLGCVGYSRTDFILCGDTPYILETNTLPGMTETSILPQQIKCVGLTMEVFLDNLIERALWSNT